eukprot:IDg18410t1
MYSGDQFLHPRGWSWGAAFVKVPMRSVDRRSCRCGAAWPISHLRGIPKRATHQSRAAEYDSRLLLREERKWRHEWKAFFSSVQLKRAVLTAHSVRPGKYTAVPYQPSETPHESGSNGVESGDLGILWWLTRALIRGMQSIGELVFCGGDPVRAKKMQELLGPIPRVTWSQVDHPYVQRSILDLMNAPIFTESPVRWQLALWADIIIPLWQNGNPFGIDYRGVWLSGKLERYRRMRNVQAVSPGGAGFSEAAQAAMDRSSAEPIFMIDLEAEVVVEEIASNSQGFCPSGASRKCTPVKQNISMLCHRLVVQLLRRACAAPSGHLSSLCLS